MIFQFLKSMIAGLLLAAACAGVLVGGGYLLEPEHLKIGYVLLIMLPLAIATFILWRRGKRAQRQPVLEVMRWPPRDEEQHGAPPSGTYHLLDRRNFDGSYYELEIDGQTVILQQPGQPVESWRAEELARVEIGRRHGKEAADNAVLKWVMSGQL